MFRLCLLAVLLIQANADYKCEENIKTEVLQDYEQLVGNWTYLVQWDNLDDEDSDEDEDDDQDDDDEDSFAKDIYCATVTISKACKYEVLRKQESCKNDSYYDFFDYANAKYKLVAPEIDIDERFIAIGDHKSFMDTCGSITSLEIRKLSDDYIIMIMFYHEHGSMLGVLLGKKIPSVEEIECLMYNVDVAKGLDAYAYCYN